MQSKPYISSIIIGARSVEQLQESLSVVETAVSKDVLDALDALSAPDKNYLWSFNEESNEQFAKRGNPFPGTIIC